MVSLAVHSVQGLRAQRPSVSPPEPGQGQGSSWGHQPHWLPPAPGHGGIKGRWQRAGFPRFVPAPRCTLQVGSRAWRTRGFSFSLRLLLVAVDGLRCWMKLVVPQLGCLNLASRCAPNVSLMAWGGALGVMHWYQCLWMWWLEGEGPRQGMPGSGSAGLAACPGDRAGTAGVCRTGQKESKDSPRLKEATPLNED